MLLWRRFIPKVKIHPYAENFWEARCTTWPCKRAAYRMQCVEGMAAQVCVCLCNPPMMWMGCLCWPRIGQHKSGDHGGGREQPKGGELGYVLILWRITGYYLVNRVDSSCKGFVLLVCVHIVGIDSPAFYTGRRRVSHTGKMQFRILYMQEHFV